MASVPTERIARLLEGKLAEGHPAYLHVVSGSMAPLLQIDDQVRVESADPGTLKAGEILLLEAPNALFTHRFWGVVHLEDGDRLVTRGDRPLSFDPLWKRDQLLGKITGWRRQSESYDLLGPAGQQLNQKLGQLAQNELQLFARLYRAPMLAKLPDGSGPSLNFNQVNRSRILTALIRRLYKARATRLVRQHLPDLRT